MIALREIKRFQKTIEHLIAKKSFARFVKKVMQNIKKNVKIQTSIFEILQKNIEAFVTKMFENKSNALFLRIILLTNFYKMINAKTIHAKRMTVQMKNIHLVRKILKMSVNNNVSII